jgi:hypothetical protein
MINFVFILHLGLMILSWIVPFLFDWRLVWAAYSVVLLQFWVFGRCLMNKGHDIDDVNSDETFYSHLLESIGFRFPRKHVKQFVRLWLLLGLGFIAWFWQYYSGQKPVFMLW